MLDAKNRLTVPARWRFEGDQDERACLAVPHPDGYVLVLPPEEIQRLRERIAGVRFGDTRGQAFWSQLMSRSQAFGLDSQGRFCVETAVLDRAGMKKEVVLVGSGPTYKLYSPEKWAAVQATDDQFRDMMKEAGF